MPRPNVLEHNLQILVESKVLNLDITMGALMKAGALSDIDPWDVFCGNGWIVRRHGFSAGNAVSPDFVRGLVREELASAGVIKG